MLTWNWIPVLISKFRVSVAGLWRLRILFFFSSLMQNLAYGLLCFALFFKTLDTERNQPYRWTSPAVTFFQMAGACVLPRVKTTIRFVVRRQQIAVNQSGKFMERSCHFPSNTGRIYRQSWSRQELTFTHIQLQVTFKCDYPRYKLSISKGQGKNPCEVLRDRRKKDYLNGCQTWKYRDKKKSTQFLKAVQE